MPTSQTPDIEGLREFELTDDRELTPFFVGRNDVISDIENNCWRRFKNWQLSRRAALAGATRLIQGAPGAGKTAILDCLAERWQDNPKAPVPVRANVEIFYDKSRLLAKIASAVASGAGHKLLSSSGRLAEVKIGPPFLQFTFERSNAPTDGHDGWDTLYGTGDAENWTRPVCLLVDEIQIVDRRANEVLHTLHEGGHGFPLVMVLAGLANSREQLRNVGISRFAADGVHTLWPLSARSAVQSVNMFLDHFHVRGRNDIKASCARWIAEDSSGWPQHLHNALKALAGALAAADGNLASVNKKDVLRRSGDYRREYYEARLTPKLKATAPLLANVFRRVGEQSASRIEFSRTVESCSRDGRESMERLPSGTTALDYVDHLIEVGVLHEDFGTVRCPIPSFRQHLIERERLAEHRPSVAPEDDSYPLPSPFD